MKKLLIALMVLGLVFLGIISSQADERRTTPHKGKTITADEVTSTQGIVLYKVTGYANTTNAVYGLYNTTTLGAAAATNVYVEGGEATQYDSLPTLDFGDEGLVFNSGLVTIVNGAYVTIEYL